MGAAVQESSHLSFMAHCESPVRDALVQHLERHGKPAIAEGIGSTEGNGAGRQRHGCNQDGCKGEWTSVLSHCPRSRTECATYSGDHSCRPATLWAP